MNHAVAQTLITIHNPDTPVVPSFRRHSRFVSCIRSTRNCRVKGPSASVIPRALPQDYETLVPVIKSGKQSSIPPNLASINSVLQPGISVRPPHLTNHQHPAHICARWLFLFATL